MIKKLMVLISVFSIHCSYTSQDESYKNFNILLKDLKLSTHRSEFHKTPELLFAIIKELYTIQAELQQIACFTQTILTNIVDLTIGFNTISDQISNLIPEKQIITTLKATKKKNNKPVSIGRTIKLLEKHYTTFTKKNVNLQEITSALPSIWEELEMVQMKLAELSHTVKRYSLSYHHKARDIFAIALALCKLTGIESDSGPYLCVEDADYQSAQL